ncbi:hypothetical protein HaLaN_27475 [Haematococcus lacustris]|uniref:Uncharacterized protein n=1 Tax=Haematococcus lacustris TaxID=44745 RepID=A0A6A0A8N1_HAELA|nr:hypothetical protein HaLaN_27475 [Haematococcus lacustris]
MVGCLVSNTLHQLTALMASLPWETRQLRQSNKMSGLCFRPDVAPVAADVPKSLLEMREATRPADWKPPAGQVEERLLRPAWSQQPDLPVRGMMWNSQVATQLAASEPGPSTPPPPKHSKRTKTEQATEPTQPTKGKEYPGLGYKRMRDKPPKAQQQLQHAAIQWCVPLFEPSPAYN